MHEALGESEQADEVRVHDIDYAEERRGFAHGEQLLLGQQHGRVTDDTVGEQVHILHNHRVWPSHLKSEYSKE